MNNNIIPLDYQGHQVRVSGTKESPLWVLKDVCEIFGETNYRRVSGRLDDDEKGVSQITTPGGIQKMIVVNESGLYSALFAMQPEKARGVSDEYIAKRQQQLRDFKRWVTHDVLPSIRKHGAYATPETLNKMISSPEFGIKLLTALKSEQDKRKALETQIEQQRAQVLFARSVSTSDSSILIGQLAKMIKQNGRNIGQNRLFAWMRENGYLIRQKGSNYNLPTQKAMDMGLFRIKESTHLNGDGVNVTTKTTKVTGKGQQYFINKFLGDRQNSDTLAAVG